MIGRVDYSNANSHGGLKFKFLLYVDIKLLRKKE